MVEKLPVPACVDQWLRGELANLPLAARPARCLGCGQETVQVALGDGRRFSPSRCPACARAETAQHQQEALATVVRQVPRRARDVRFSSPVVLAEVKRPAAIEEAKQAAESGAVMIVLTGWTGRGKTLLAAALFHQILDAVVPGCPPSVLARARGLRWLSAIQIGVAYRESKLGDIPPTMRTALGATTLVIDELGRESDVSAVWRVLSDRHENEKPTIVTTGLTYDQMIDRYEDAGVRRLAERSYSIDCNEVSEIDCPAHARAARYGA